MGRTVSALAAAACVVIPSAITAEELSCQLCEEAREAEEQDFVPIRVDVQNGLTFSRLALLNRGDGEAEIDPLTGQKRTRNNLVDLGGASYGGRAVITGEPLQPVRIRMPRSVTLHSPGGGEALLTDFVTDLPSLPMLDANGLLEFNFGARLSTQGGASGNFRGRISIRVDYD